MQFHILDDIQVLSKFIPTNRWFSTRWCRQVNGMSFPYSVAEVVVSSRRDLLTMRQVGKKAIDIIDMFLEECGLGVSLSEYQLIQWVKNHFEVSQSERAITSKIYFTMPVSHLLELMDNPNDIDILKKDILRYGDLPLLEFLSKERIRPGDYHSIEFFKRYHLRYHITNIELVIWNVLYPKTEPYEILSIPKHLMEVSTKSGKALFSKADVSSIFTTEDGTVIYLNNNY